MDCDAFTKIKPEQYFIIQSEQKANCATSLACALMECDNFFKVNLKDVEILYGFVWQGALRKTNRMQEALR